MSYGPFVASSTSASSSRTGIAVLKSTSSERAGTKVLDFNLFINSFTNSDNLKDYVKKETKSLVKEFKTISAKINDRVTKIKLAETMNQLAKVANATKINDNHITSLIMCYELQKELSDVASTIGRSTI